MKLLNEEIKQRFKEVGSQEQNPDPLVIAKFFDPCGSATWYSTEYEPESNTCFGYVTGLFVDEWGSFSINELESIELPFGLTIERDIHTDEKPISKLVPELAQLKKLNEIRNKREERDQIEELER